MKPIWKPYFINYNIQGTGNAYIDIYVIDIIQTYRNFIGRYKVNHLTNSIQINSFIRNWLSTSLPLSVLENPGDGYFFHSESSKYFEFVITYDGGQAPQTIRESFINDYSYDNNVDYTVERSLSNPVNGHGTSGMFKFYSVYDTTGMVHTYYTVDEGFGYDISHCGEWCLYYLNKYGGFDCFLIEGSCKERYEFENNVYKTVLKGNLENTEKIYNRNVTKSFEVTTGFLKDDESTRLAENLYSSPLVYLHNINSGEIYGVVITDTSCEKKTYSNERKLFNYTIQLRCNKLDNYLV